MCWVAENPSSFFFLYLNGAAHLCVQSTHLEYVLLSIARIHIDPGNPPSD